MLHPARIVTLLVVLVLCLLGRGLRSDETAPVQQREPASATAQHNTPLVIELTGRWRTLPEVLEAQAGYDEAQRLVTASAVCDSCDRKALADRLSRDIWTSSLLDVDRVRVQVAHDLHRSTPVTQQWSPVADARALFERFGNGMVDPDRAPAG